MGILELQHPNKFTLMVRTGAMTNVGWSEGLPSNPQGRLQVRPALVLCIVTLLQVNHNGDLPLCPNSARIEMEQD